MHIVDAHCTCTLYINPDCIVTEIEMTQDKNKAQFDHKRIFALHLVGTKTFPRMNLGKRPKSDFINFFFNLFFTDYWYIKPKSDCNCHL